MLILDEDIMALLVEEDSNDMYREIDLATEYAIAFKRRMLNINEFVDKDPAGNITLLKRYSNVAL